MSEYLKIQSQIEKLRREAEKARASEIAGVAKKVRQMIETFGLTPQDLWPEMVGGAAAGDGEGLRGAQVQGDVGAGEPEPPAAAGDSVEASLSMPELATPTKKVQANRKVASSGSIRSKKTAKRHGASAARKGPMAEKSPAVRAGRGKPATKKTAARKSGGRGVQR
jgi:hypothetical protein